MIMLPWLACLAASVKVDCKMPIYCHN
uniref:Uncharacterized protein n=1 Tax=Arundo donax TaxID=35708 RepID=A0A0A9CDH3_ARUDO